uniref:Adhesion G protein-coupled receptor F3 n=1 Tax=Syphacia muris TaxID=451379 RepID=A0A0N5A9R6_9BILA
MTLLAVCFLTYLTVLLGNVAVLLAAETTTIQMPSTTVNNLKTLFAQPIPALNQVSVNKLSTDGTVKIWLNSRTLCTVPLPSNTKETLIFPCNCFPVISNNYKLFFNDIFIMNFTVTEPLINDSQLQQHMLCTNLRLTSMFPICMGTNLRIRLQYRPTKVLPQMEHYFNDIWNTSSALDKELLIPQQYFTIPGFYRILLENNASLWLLRIVVENAGEYSLRLEQSSIFPSCKKHIRIAWTKNNCLASSLAFRLRIFAVPDGSSPDRSYYLEEIHLDFNDTYVLLPCSIFDIIYSHFCFELVSIQQNTNFFYSWHKVCIKTEDCKLGHVNGEWSSWGNWSSCSTTCGQGVRRRFRYCNKPLPKGSGSFCSSNFFETQNCSIKCSEVPQEYCSCGCNIDQYKGTFFAHVCSGSQARWILQPKGRLLTLHVYSAKSFDQFRFEMSLDMVLFSLFSQMDCDMIRSGNTETTVLNAEKVVTKRSIGIQLSTTSTPRIPSSRDTSSLQPTPRLQHSSLSCFGDHELEYDYYEPAIPGSFLTPVQDFYSEIDIDQIIGESCLRDLDIMKSDAITQA